MNLRVRPRVKTVIGFHIVDMKKGVIRLVFALVKDTHLVRKIFILWSASLKNC